MSAAHPATTLEHPAHHPALMHQFDDLRQQDSACTLGMWAFLATEVMFFGGLFTAYIVFRSAYPAAFAEASHHLKAGLGAVNTGVLLCSSLAMALAVHAAQEGHRRGQVLFLLLTMALGAAFLGIKGYEYYVDYEEHLIPGLDFNRGMFLERGDRAELFFIMYFFMTGLHAFHMIIGLSVMAVLAYQAWRHGYAPEEATTVHAAGLYWHFVDVVWVFLYPLLYLINLHEAVVPH